MPNEHTAAESEATPIGAPNPAVVSPADSASPSVEPLAPPPPVPAVKLDLPPEIQGRLTEWHRLWIESVKLHYVFGALSVTASAVGAAVGGESARYLAAMAAVLTALIGFVQPERRYFKFVNAWRVLDVAALRYKYGKLDLDNLFSAVEKGERIISEYENKAEQEQATPVDQKTEDAKKFEQGQQGGVPGTPTEASQDSNAPEQDKPKVP